MAQKIKNATARQEAQEMPVPSLGPEDLLEKGMAAHSSILASRASHPKKGAQSNIGLPWWLRG